MEDDTTEGAVLEGPQNLHDLQNYLVTFNKEIGVTGDSTFQQNISQYVEAQQGSEDVFPPDTGQQETGEDLLSKLKVEKQSEVEQILSGEIHDNIVVSEVKQGVLDDKTGDEVSIEPLETDEQLNAVHAQIAGLTSGQIQAVSISGHIPLESLQGLQAGSGEGVMMIPINGDSMMTGGSQQLFQLVRLDGAGQATLHLSKDQEDTNGPPCEDENTTVGAIQASDGQMIDGTDPVAVLASVAANTSNISQLQISQQDLNSAQLVALQSSADSSQPQLVAVQNMDGSLGEAGLQMISGIEGVVSSSLVYNAGAGGITLLPAGDLNQQYVLIMNPHQNGDKGGGPIYDFGDDIKGEIIEEVTDENGTTKRIVKINQLLAKKSLENLPGIPYGDQLMCTYCDYTSPKRYLLSRHMKTHSEDRPHKCSLCQRGFKTQASLQNHMNTHAGIRPHKCKMCDAAFTTSGELVRHIRYKHTFEKPHKCTECDYASVELSKLKRHIRSHTGERPYQCVHCNYASPDTYKLKRHLRIHTGEKPYECNICHARFTQSNSLKAHKLIHTGNKPVFQCELCPATCGRKTDLKIHMQKLHSSEKPLTCKKCGETYPDRYTFKMHTKTHEGEKCYKCPDCDYAALSIRHLETHALTHTGEKPYECTDCDQSFRQKQLLKRHKNLYHTPDYTPPNPKDKEHECSECEKAYAHKGNLLRHMQQHDDESPVEKIVCTHQKPTRVVPLTADQLIHNSLLADMKEGKLGTSPKVVVVHPDGRVEEVTAKLQSMSQSKPVDDFLVSLGVTADSNYGVDESGDAHVDSGNEVLVMSSEAASAPQSFQPEMESAASLRQQGSPGNSGSSVRCEPEKALAMAEPESDDDQRREAGTQAAFDSDSEEENRRKTLKKGQQPSPSTDAAASGDLPPVLTSGQTEPADLEDVQKIVISVLEAEARSTGGPKRSAEVNQDGVSPKKQKQDTGEG